MTNTRRGGNVPPRRAPLSQTDCAKRVDRLSVGSRLGLMFIAGPSPAWPHAMTRLRILAAGALLALGACKDSTGSQPEPELTVQLTATASDPTFRSGADGEQLIECSIS